MRATIPKVAGDPRAAQFDAICAGEALWKVATAGTLPSLGLPRVRLEPECGIVNVALALAREGLRVGLATVLADDEAGREARARIAAAGIDVGGVTLAPSRARIVRVDARGGAEQVGADGEEPAIEVPGEWSSRVLVLSGLSPVVSRAAALCKAARAARRKGALVVIDFNAALHVWAGRDPRTIRMVLREVDVARCSAADLAVIGMDEEAVRAELRGTAVLVVGEADGGVRARGAFGEVGVKAGTREPRARRARLGLGDAFTAGVCAELTRRREPGESVEGAWARALRKGREAAMLRAEG